MATHIIIRQVLPCLVSLSRPDIVGLLQKVGPESKLVEFKKCAFSQLMNAGKVEALNKVSIKTVHL